MILGMSQGCLNVNILNHDQLKSYRTIIKCPFIYSCLPLDLEEKKRRKETVKISEFVSIYPISSVRACDYTSGVFSCIISSKRDHLIPSWCPIPSSQHVLIWGGTGFAYWRRDALKSHHGLVAWAQVLGVRSVPRTHVYYSGDLHRECRDGGYQRSRCFTCQILSEQLTPVETPSSLARIPRSLGDTNSVFTL